MHGAVGEYLAVQWGKISRMKDIWIGWEATVSTTIGALCILLVEHILLDRYRRKISNRRVATWSTLIGGWQREAHYLSSSVQYLDDMATFCNGCTFLSGMMMVTCDIDIKNNVLSFLENTLLDRYRRTVRLSNRRVATSCSTLPFICIWMTWRPSETGAHFFPVWWWWLAILI